MLRRAYAILSLSTILSIACTSSTPTPRDTKTLRIATSKDFSNLDPRKARNLETMNLMHFLYEGLYRPSTGVQAYPGVAQEVSISEDGATYRFLLRPCRWSDGFEISSHDFLESWKTMLDPKFAAPNAYQLFVIKNAKEIYEGNKPLSELGCEAPDDRTLIVRLQEPNFAFLQMVATPPFFPVPRHIDQTQKRERPVGNGPYVVDSWRPQCDLTLAKNAKYWALSSSQPNKIVATVLEESTALSMFKKGELDWIGSPLSALPSDAVAYIKKLKNFKVTPCAGTHFIRVNTRKEGLNNVGVRRTLSQAIDRKELTQHILQGGQKPARTLLPPLFGKIKHPIRFNNILSSAQMKQKVSKLTLTYEANDQMTKIAQRIQDNWKSKLGLEITLQPTDSANLVHSVSTGNYDLAIGSWQADFLDPINFLSVFENANNGTNNTGWESIKYQELLKKGRTTLNDTLRRGIYLKADRLLSLESPIIPLYYAAFNYMTADTYEHSKLTPLGIITFEK